MVIIIKGNPIDGLRHIGPFPDYTTAAEYADKIDDSDWWVSTLESPEDGE